MKRQYRPQYRDDKPSTPDKNEIATKIAKFLGLSYEQITVSTVIDPNFEVEILYVSVMCGRDPILIANGFGLPLADFNRFSRNILDILKTRFGISDILIANGFVDNKKTLNDKTYEISHIGYSYSINKEFYGTSSQLLTKLKEIKLIE